ncbi:MAG TPA: VanZ family protein [Thermoflexus sp.]|nr:VanZ family protein [Thermoflexus sp.]
MPKPWGSGMAGGFVRRASIAEAIARVPVAVRWGVTILWMGVIFFLSAQPQLPQAPEPWLDFLAKKAAHALEYVILAALARWTLGAYPLEGPGRWAWAWAALYALTDEIHQGLVPGRHPSGLDVLIDMGGAWIGAGGWRMARGGRHEA